MRPTLRLSAAVKPGSGRFLEAGNPTGLTGLFTHPSPRPTLLCIYGLTLDRLKEMPESSVYRQSCEALTKHRLRIVDDVKPAGWEEWKGRAMEKIKKNPDILKPGASRHLFGRIGDRGFVETAPEQDMTDGEWDGKETATLHRSMTEKKPEQDMTAVESDAEKADKVVDALYRALTEQKPDPRDSLEWEPEPPLDLSQINDIEEQIGAGLIEEVLQVAEGELQLVSTMAESKAWEELEEKPEPGQWDYFSRDQHTKPTQAP